MAGKFELKVAKNGKYYFSLLAGNGQNILQSEMYESKSAAENGIASVKKNAPDDARYSREESKKGEPYFTLKAGKPPGHRQERNVFVKGLDGERRRIRQEERSGRPGRRSLEVHSIKYRAFTLANSPCPQAWAILLSNYENEQNTPRHRTAFG